MKNITKILATTIVSLLMVTVSAGGKHHGCSGKHDCGGSLVGTGNTTSTDPSGQTIEGELFFNFDAHNKGKNGKKGYGSYSNNGLYQLEGDPDGVLKGINGSMGNIKCLVVDGNTAWFAAELTYAAPDVRVTEEENAQTQQLIEQGRGIEVGYLVDNGSSGDMRSLFLSGTSVVEPYVGPIGSVSLGGGGGLAGANVRNVCQRRNDMLITSVFERVSETEIQWINGDVYFLTEAREPIGAPVPNTVENINNPPPEALTDLLTNVTREFNRGDVTIKSRDKCKRRHH